MKSVLISIRPKWCELIANGQKTVEVRKTKPKLEPPFKVYIYCTGGPPYLNSHNGYCCCDIPCGVDENGDDISCEACIDRWFNEKKRWGFHTLMKEVTT